MNNSTELNKIDMLISAAMPHVGKNEIDKYNEIAGDSNISDKSKKRVYKRIMREIKYRERHNSYNPHVVNFKRVLIAVLAAASIAFAGVMSISAVREEIFNAIVTWFENSLNLVFDDERECAPSTIEEYREPTLGAEYERYEINRSERTYSIEYESSTSLISYHQYIRNEFDVIISNYDTKIKDISIMEYNGVCTNYESQGFTVTTIVWQDDLYSYSLSGNLSCEELIEIAKSIK